MIDFKRERWVIVCKDHKLDCEKREIIDIPNSKEKIFCGLARNYQLKDINGLGNTAIKTYLSKKKAESSFISSWWHGEELIEKNIARAVKIVESLIEVKE